MAADVLLISLDSCRFDTFVRRKQLARFRTCQPLVRCIALRHPVISLTAHAAMWLVPPGVEDCTIPVNPKADKDSEVLPARWSGRYFQLRSESIEGFRRSDFPLLGAVDWFNPQSETGAVWEPVRAFPFRREHVEPGASARLD